MHRAFFTLLVGLMLSLGGGANALTFKSDGSVVQNNGAVVNSSDKPAEVPDLSKYEEFRVIDFDVAGKKYSTYTAFSQGSTLFGFKAKGVLVYQAEFCEWQSVIRNSKTKTGSFEAECPSGANVNGEFTFVGNHAGSYGAGVDNSGQKVSYNLKGRGSTTKANVTAFFEQTKSFDEARRLYENASDKSVCSASSTGNLAKFEAKRRGLSCGVDEDDTIHPVTASTDEALKTKRTAIMGLSDSSICQPILRMDSSGRKFFEVKTSKQRSYMIEAKRRGLTCGIEEVASTQVAIASTDSASQTKKTAIMSLNDDAICRPILKMDSNGQKLFEVKTSKQRAFMTEARRRGLTCGVEEAGPTQVATTLSTNADLLAAQRRAAELEKQLALLQAKEELNQRQAASDNQVPLLTIIQSGANGREGYLTGSVTDNVAIAEVLVDGAPVTVAADGSFEWAGFVPATGKDFVVEAIDTAALSSKQVVRLERGQNRQKGILRFDELNPMTGKIAELNQNALALIVGISEYDRTNAPAIFADNDAQFFQDYAALKLGIPENNIITLLNADAGQVDVLLSVKNWLARAVKQEQSDVYVFFAGHGLASDDGDKMYLLPVDGEPRLLDKTAILRDELFSDIAAANPRSVTVFLDTCYSGTTRGPDMLIAARPIAIRAKEQVVPEGFTVMTAAAGDQTAKPLEEAKHGMFSYFLMKGMEGDADANQDNQITAGELHAYVQQNVIQQSSGSQTPELQGDADKVLVKFQ